MTIWFTSDLHLGHKNIIKYSNRPFSSVDEMNEVLIANWNAVVRPTDEVYFLGDFCLTHEHKAVEFAGRLAGKKHLIFGNHDKRLRKNKHFLGHWIWTKDYAEITINDQKVVLSHYPFATWNKSHHGSFHCHGHCHGSLKEEPHLRRMDVGVDPMGMQPVSFEQVKEHMSKKEWKPIDHHGAD